MSNKGKKLDDALVGKASEEVGTPRVIRPELTAQDTFQAGLYAQYQSAMNAAPDARGLHRVPMLADARFQKLSNS